MIYMFLAEGFEEIEALGTLDILRRAGINVSTVSIGDSYVLGSHAICIKSDKTIDEISFEDCEGVILPGGLPGTTNLEKSPIVSQYVDYAFKRGLLLAAICAAPSVLGHKGLLNGKKATAYPGYEDGLIGAEYTGEPATVDGNIITGKGAGAVFEFGLYIVKELINETTANKLRSQMQCTE